jgi:hypothetical protein
LYTCRGPRRLAGESRAAASLLSANMPCSRSVRDVFFCSPRRISLVVMKPQDVRVGMRLKATNPTGEPCCPHGPLMVRAVKEDSRVVWCLRCGAAGPEREDSMGAKLAFDELFEALE